MRFTTARLCGGEALMAISSEVMDLSMDRVASVLSGCGHTVKQKDDMMLITEWNGMEVTIYPQGKVMFFPLKDKSACIRYATGIMDSVSGSDSAL